MLIGQLKRWLQDHLTDGIAIIVGSGLSAQMGIPSMLELAKHIEANPPALTALTYPQWSRLCDELDEGHDLETALSTVDFDAGVEEHIVDLTAKLIEEQERPVFRDVVAGKLKLPFSDLLRHLRVTASAIPVITTNYDRLIELACDTIDLAVDSTFSGQVIARFDPTMSRESLGFAAHTRTRKDIQRKYRQHVRLFKPHGSIDWYSHNGVPVRSGLPLPLPRLMITPGKTKYVRGYDQPFDAHRNGANEAVDRAARFLVIGFGFNDRQLETHLRPRLKSGQSCVILARHLTPNASALAKSCPSVVALSSGAGNGIEGTLLTTKGSEQFYPTVRLWNLANFLEEVLG